MPEDYSFNTGLRRSFSALDYVWFAVSLALSSGIGLYHAIKYRNRETPADFHVGGRKMSPFPVALSLIVTFLSPITLLGVPGEVYTHDTMFWWLGVAIIVAVGTSSHVFHVFFYGMKITSIYEYLFRRFGRIIRLIGSCTWFIYNMLYQAFVLCGPAMAINAVTGLDLWISIMSVGCVATFYTTLGGMKTVIWTDSLQALIILVGLLSVFIRGSLAVGGLGEAWNIAANSSRIKFVDFSFDPTVRHSFWSVFVGGGFFWLSAYSTNQAEVQRALSCSNQNSLRLAMWMTGIGMLFIISLCCLIGVVMFAFYSQCDPLNFNNLVSNSDQLFPLYVMDILHGTYGLPGIVLSAICAGSLSTISSILNGMSAVALEDYIRPYFLKSLTSKQATVISKATVVICGTAAVGLAFITSKAGSQMQISYSICTVLAGPLFSCFIVGLFIPRAKQMDMIIGYLSTCLLMIWLRITNFYYGDITPFKPTSVNSCNWNVTLALFDNITSSVDVDLLPGTTQTPDSEEAPWAIYNLSYLYYALLGTILSVVITTLSSFVTGIWITSDVDPDLIHPIVHKISALCSKREARYTLNVNDEKKSFGKDAEEANGDMRLLPTNENA